MVVSSVQEDQPRVDLDWSRDGPVDEAFPDELEVPLNYNPLYLKSDACVHWDMWYHDPFCTYISKLTSEDDGYRLIHKFLSELELKMIVSREKKQRLVQGHFYPMENFLYTASLLFSNALRLDCIDIIDYFLPSALKLVIIGYRFITKLIWGNWLLSAPNVIRFVLYRTVIIILIIF